MYKYLTAILLFVFAFQEKSFAQEDSTFVPEHLIGFTGGINMVSVFSEEPLNYKDIYGKILISNPYLFKYNGGISYKYISGKNVGLMIEFLYSQKGGYNEFMFDVNGNVTDSVLFEHQLDYGQFSFITDVRIGKKNSKINLYLGPQISYLIKQNIVLKEDTYGYDFKKNTDINFEYGINVGGGYSFNFNKGELELRFLYTHDFSNIFPAKSVNNFTFNQNQVYSLNLSYYYKIYQK